MSSKKRDTTVRDNHRKIIARDEPNCWICGQEIDYTLKYPDPYSFVVDHKIPLDDGGSDTLGNKAAAHNTCNRDKSNKPFASIIKRSRSIRRPTD